MKKKRVTILGSTGSVGQTALGLIAQYPDDFVVHALVADNNVEALAKDAARFSAEHAILANTSCFQDLKQALATTSVHVAAGYQSILEICAEPVDIVIAAISGAAGLMPTFAACGHARVVGIANKESLVCAGPLIMKAAARSGARIVPVDSEHHALSCLLRGIPKHEVRELILTASGGPFRERRDLSTVTPQQALCHPIWSMGKKISIDSATLMNKGLELIEACVLFDMDESRIQTIVHPESIIHGLVTCANGGTMAHLAPADMRYPLRDVLFDVALDVLPPLDLNKISQLRFEPVDHQRFPSIALARSAYRAGQGACVALNAANECAVMDFLGGNIRFLDIFSHVESALQRYGHCHVKTLEDILALDGEVRNNMGKNVFG